MKLGLVIVKSAENQSVYCFREKVANLLSLKGSLKSKKFRKQTPPKMAKTRGFLGLCRKKHSFLGAFYEKLWKVNNPKKYRIIDYRIRMLNYLTCIDS